MTDCEQAIAYLKSALPDDVNVDIVLEEADSPVARPVAPGLVEMYVVDRGTHFAFVQYRTLVAEGCTPDTLRQVGMKNLEAAVKGKLRVQDCGLCWMLLADGNFEASMMLLDDVWNTDTLPMLPSEFVVAVPSRDVLIFGDAHNWHTIEAMRAAIERVSATGDHLLAKSFYERVDGAWRLADFA